MFPSGPLTRSYVRVDGRREDELRPLVITPGYLDFADGSALIEMGRTRVLCAVSVEEGAPSFLRGKGQGWITAEYGMLPRSTPTRTAREAALGRVGGRTQEIQRLIGRSLRASCDLRALGERTFIADCDVLQADGGTRMAAVTGAYVALALAIAKLRREQVFVADPLRWAVAGISVGLVDGVPCLDLCYEEDCRAGADFNVVMTSASEFVELQGSAEGSTFSRQDLSSLLDLAEVGIRKVLAAQEAALAV